MDPIGDFEKILKGSRPMEKEGIESLQLASGNKNMNIRIEEVVKELAEQIQKDFSDYHADDGFFWGQQFQEESVKEYKEQDIKFLKFCEQSINEKKGR